MKKIILIGLLVVLIVLSGCNMASNYSDCYDDCAKVECGYDRVLKATYAKDQSCGDKGITIREVCYKECK